MRSGAQTLLLLAAPLNISILKRLAEGPETQTALRRLSASPAQSTLRMQLKRLADAGAIEKRRQVAFPSVVEHELTLAGRDLLRVADVVSRWLADAPEGPLSLGSNAAKAAIKALSEGWTTTVVRALAGRPLSLTELDGLIGSLSYPALERRLRAMRLAGQIQVQSSNGHGNPYSATRWLRQGVAPLAAATRWERRHRPQSTNPIGRLDIEAAFLLALPIVCAGEDLTGTCRMAAEISSGGERRLAGVIASVRDGAVASCSTKLNGSPEAWALGSPNSWLDAVIDGDSAALEMGGNYGLAQGLLDALHRALFRAGPGTFSRTKLDSQ